MAETSDTHNQRSQYPPPDDPNQGNYYNQGSPRGPPPPRDEKYPYPPQQQGPPPPQDPSRQGQYPGQYPPDPRAQSHYPHPQQWGPPPPGYPPQSHYPDPHHPAYQYGPPRHDYGQPPQPMQPDAYRLPPPVPPGHYYYPPYAAPQAPAPRQRTAIACKYCRKRKIRCSGYDSSTDGRCANCVRFNQQCLFHPVSSQATFVPASAVYGPNAGRAGQPGDPNGILYGAHGQPLGPAQGNPPGQPPYGYGPPPQHYSQQPYSPAGPPQYAHGLPSDGYGQGPPPQGESVSIPRKRPIEDENTHTDSQSPHPTSRPRDSAYEARNNSSSAYEAPAPSSPTNSQMSYQTNPPANAYTNGHQKTNSPPAGLTPQSAHSFNSPRQIPIRGDDGRTPPPPQPGSAGSSTNGRNGMSISDMVGAPHGAEQRARNDVDALNKLDGKKK